MSGTKKGGIAAAATNKERYGEDFYHIQGAKGGKKSTGGGFAASFVDPITGMTGRDRAKLYGAMGGKVSRKEKTYSRKTGKWNNE